MYCVRCKDYTADTDVNVVRTKNNRTQQRSPCAICGTMKCKFVKTQSGSSGGDLVGMINKVTSNFTLPGQKFPGEVHLPGHNFTGPGTRLDLRLNDNLSPKSWSTPVDRVDNAAYHHDLAYAANKDTASRNVADRAMVDELNSIPNPTFKEKIERMIVTPILASKAKFGLGFQKSAFKRGVT